MKVLKIGNGIEKMQFFDLDLRFLSKCVYNLGAIMNMRK